MKDENTTPPIQADTNASQHERITPVTKIDSGDADQDGTEAGKTHALNGNHHELHLGLPTDGIDITVFDTEEKRHIPVTDPSLFPDGGIRAWSVVASSFLLVFCTFGTLF